MEELNILQNIKVLYVEDETITRQRTAMHLKNLVGKVITALNVEEAIKKFKEFKPDIIITDLILPDGNGNEMIHKFRVEGNGCPVIITSSVNDIGTILKSIDEKIDKYIVKPIDLDELTNTLKVIAIRLAEQKGHIILNSGEFILSREEKNKLELEIRNIYSKYLKAVTGKGAKSIQIFIKGRVIEVLVKENLTVIEENLIKLGRHYKGVEVIRKTIYENTKDVIEKELSDYIGREIRMGAIEIQHEKGYELTKFNII